jgi:hypothetical protein
MDGCWCIRIRTKISNLANCWIPSQRDLIVRDTNEIEARLVVTCDCRSGDAISVDA